MEEKEASRTRSVISLQHFPQDGDLHKPLEDLVEQTVRNNPLFTSREALLSEEDPKALLFWAKTLSLHAKKLKSFYLRVKKGDSEQTSNNNANIDRSDDNDDSIGTNSDQSDYNGENNNDIHQNNHIPHNNEENNHNNEHFNANNNIINHKENNGENNEDGESFHWSNNQVELVYIHFHATSIQKFELCSTLDPFNSFEHLNPANYLQNSGRGKRSKYPYMELCYEWGLASLRYGKALEMQRDFESAYLQHKKAALLFMRVVYEDKRRKFTSLVFNKIVISFERLAKVKPTYTEVRTYCDLFLVQFSNIAMRGEMKQLNLKPLTAMCLSNSRHVRESNAIDVVRHLGKFFETEFGTEAAAQLGHLEQILSQSQDKETQLQKLLTPEALKRLEKSEIKKEEYLEHIEVIINLLQWKGKPPCRLSFSTIPHNINSDNWRRDNPKKLFRDQIKLSGDDCHADAMVVLAKRKSDRLSVSIKIMKKFSEHEKEIYNEIAILDYFSNHSNFTHLLEVFLYRDEVWAVSEYSNAGNLVDVIPTAEMSEEEIAYISKEILTGLHFLHSNNRMHRDLTSDNILLNMSGEIMISDFEVYLGNSYQRYWLPPELLLSEPYPYGTEVDIWSFGCIVYEMVDGHPPYSDFRPLKEFFYTATRGAPPISKPNMWSSDFRHFLSCAMHIDPKKRHTAAQLLEHPFMKKAYKREDFADALQMKISFFR